VPPVDGEKLETVREDRSQRTGTKSVEPQKGKRGQ